MKLKDSRDIYLNSLKNPLVFFLPLKTRPRHLPKLTDNNFKEFWHTGVIYKGFVYETYNNEKYDISRLKDRGRQLIKMEAEFVPYEKINYRKLKNEIYSGTSCDEYVLRALGLSNLKGNKKGDKYPDDVYKIVKGENNEKPI